jgi:predicted nuclease of predicted toxin-antitoxin system
MRLLLDECVPRPLLRDLAGHDAHHVVDMGWSSRRNGELLNLMLADRFEVLLTVDQNLPFQQNLRGSGIGVVVVVARTNRVKELRPLVPQILEALAAVKPGELRTVGG